MVVSLGSQVHHDPQIGLAQIEPVIRAMVVKDLFLVDHMMDRTKARPCQYCLFRYHPPDIRAKVLVGYKDDLFSVQ